MTTVVCKKCGWEWVTKSRAWILSCPGCGSKVKIPERFVQTVSEVRVGDVGDLEVGGLVEDDKDKI